MNSISPLDDFSTPMRLPSPSVCLPDERLFRHYQQRQFIVVVERNSLHCYIAAMTLRLLHYPIVCVNSEENAFKVLTHRMFYPFSMWIKSYKKCVVEDHMALATPVFAVIGSLPDGASPEADKELEKNFLQAVMAERERDPSIVRCPMVAFPLGNVSEEERREFQAFGFFEVIGEKNIEKLMACMQQKMFLEIMRKKVQKDQQKILRLARPVSHLAMISDGKEEDASGEEEDVSHREEK